MTILIAEDNELNRELMRELLSAHGFTVLEARSGAEAIAMLSRHTPDLVLLDIQMPDGDGFWVLREIRAAAGLAGLPVLAVTAFAMKGDRDRIIAAGFSGYISKPLSAEALISAVRGQLERCGHA